MKYEATIDGRNIAIELEERDGRVSATIERRAYNLEVSRPEKGVYLIFAGGQTYEAHVWADKRNTMQVKLRGRRFEANIVDRRHRKLATEHCAEGRQNLISPMPGKVVRIMLAVGAEVTAGQGVVVVEAMKMQNEIKSPKPGRVVEVRISEGETVDANQVLAIVDDSGTR